MLSSIKMYMFIKYCILVVVFCVWSIGYYAHFVQYINRKKLMVGLVGKGHVREYQMAYERSDADLWVFGRRKRRALRLHFTSRRSPFDVFRDTPYENMLLLHRLESVPLTPSSTSVVKYVMENETVATMWPRLNPWPPPNADALAWYEKNGGPVTTVQL